MSNIFSSYHLKDKVHDKTKTSLISRESRDYDPVITGLRAYSIIFVLIYHYLHELFPLFSGYKGVDIFFVISGYLIIGHIARAVGDNEFSLGKFYAKRIIRLFPSLLILLFLVMFFGYVFMLSEEYASLSKYVFGTIFFFTNIISWLEVNYFDASAELKPLIHMWSLGIEEQFYATFPLLIIILAVFKRRILPYLFVCTLASVVLCIVISPRMQVATFYLLPTRFWEIGVGGILAIWKQSNPQFQLLSSAFKYNLSIGIVLILVSLTFSVNGFLFFDIALTVMGTTFILLNTKQAGIGHLMLNNNVTDIIGKISYPLYVFHFPVISAYAILGIDFTLEQRVVALVLLFCFSYVVYRYVEVPLSKAPKLGTLIVLLILSIVLIAGSQYVVLKSGLPNRIFGNIEYNQEILGFHDVYKQRMKLCSVVEGVICFVPIDSDVPPRIALLGDSHADHLAPSMPVVFNEEGSIYFGTYACPPLKGIMSFALEDKYRCTNMNERASKYVIEQNTIELVILAFAMPFYYTESGYAYQHLGAGEPMLLNVKSVTHQADTRGDRFAMISKSLQETVDYYLLANKKVVLILDVPEFPFMPAHCINRSNLLQAKTCTIPIDVYLQRQKSMRDFVSSELQGRKNVFVYDPINVFCDQKECKIKSDDHFLYRDSNHLSIYGSNAMTRDLRIFIATNDIIKLKHKNDF